MECVLFNFHRAHVNGGVMGTGSHDDRILRLMFTRITVIHQV